MNRLVTAATILAAIGLIPHTVPAQETRTEQEPAAGQQGPQQQAGQQQAGQQQGGQQAGQQQQGQDSVERMALAKPSDLEGIEVLDARENEIGQIERVVLNRADGHLYLVVSSDEFLGLGAEDMAVAANQVRGSGDKAIIDSTDVMVPYVEEEFLLVEEP